MIGKNKEKNRLKELEMEVVRLHQELEERDKKIAYLTQKLDAVKGFVKQMEEETQAMLGTVRGSMPDVQATVRKLEALERVIPYPYTDKETEAGGEDNGKED